MSCATEEERMPRRQRIPRDKAQCARCDARSTQISRNLPHCRECYLSALSQRFVRSLYSPLRHARASTSSRPLTQPGQVVVALSGGAGSAAMMRLLDEHGCIGYGDGRRADRTKGEKDVLWDDGTVVHVDFEAVTGVKAAIVCPERYRVLRIRAEEVYDQSLPERLGGATATGSGSGSCSSGTGKGMAVELDADLPFIHASSSATPLERLTTTLNALAPASRPAFLSHILNAILGIVAASLPNVSHVLLGETSTREAQRIIGGTASGRGWALPLELAPTVGGRVKPMKDMTVKEAATFCYMNEIETMNERRWATRSIEGLTEKFIAGLSVTHPATVSTINKTGNKLVFAGDHAEGAVCPLCQWPVDPSARDWKSRTAITSLYPESELGVAAAKNAGAGAPPESAHHTASTLPSPSPGLADLLCYACLTLMSGKNKSKDSGSHVEMPPYVGERVLRRVGEGEMRSQIEGFLL